MTVLPDFSSPSISGRSMTRILFACLSLTLGVGLASLPLPSSSAQDGKKETKKSKTPDKPQFALAGDKLKALKDFQVDLIYSVPKETQGSWVNLCFDPEGRLYASDQYGALYRVSLPKSDAKSEPVIEKLSADIGAAQGMLFAFDSLYIVVNGKTPGGKGSGLYRLKSSKPDGLPDRVELLRTFEGGGGEHGPHAVLPHPDGKRLTIVCGNQTKLVKYDTTRVPPVWGEDHLLPRVPDGNGFMKGMLAPGGFIANVDPDGKNWELISIGFRNQYDAAYDRNGELFTYDADMEWDYNTPWYRPTRVCHVTQGSEWGWRNGAGKYPEYYADNLPPVVNVGPGSPTGVCFGTGAKFPAKYQKAFFIADWSYGKLYAVHMTPKGSSYSATFEEFVTGTPLPLTDMVVNPKDGAMYFAIGGRKTQSGLYRVVYTGKEATTEAAKEPVADAVEVRRELEKFQTKQSPEAVAEAFKHLGSDDRFLRNAARTVLEFQPIETWADKAFDAKEPTTKLAAILALARVAAPCPEHAKAGSLQSSKPELGPKILAALAKIEFAKLSYNQKLDYARVLQVAWHRHGTAATPRLRGSMTSTLESVFPTGLRFVDAELAQVLIHLDSTTVAAKAMKLLADAPTQEEQMEYVRALRVLKSGWTPELRKAYFTWFVQAGNYKGGNSFQGFLRLIKADAVALLTAEEKTALASILEAKPATAATAIAKPRPFVKKHTVDELAPAVEAGLKAGGRNYEMGRKLFAATTCFACHRYDNEGGSNGPDLSGIAGRFNTRDLLDSIIDPSKEVSDQYAAVEIATLDGKMISGRIVNLNGDSISVNTDMLNPNGIVGVNRNNIDEIRPSKLSMMPAGLLDTLTAEEVIDLTAYMLSRGDRGHAMFRK